MIACLDVQYTDDRVLAACVVFRGWKAEKPLTETVVAIEGVAAYEPGQFYRRELPCLLRALEGISPDIIIVDGYVWLGGEDHPGLGAHLYEAWGRRAVVVGVAKTRFHSATLAVPVCRGESRSPLYVTAVGMDANQAAECVAGMNGPYRVPNLLKRVDQLCRGMVAAS
ncbi:endonuclease V [Zavarzinella formosa]|uniref:endonuclease V n=1 Tax=Zavarzinella formosa TaxID=360055 RepID=UPI0002E5C774|nr:endonuclease V [Zavarzinella formosa]